MLLASLPVACVFAVVSPLAHTFSPFSTLLPLACVNIALCGLEYTFTFSLAGEKFPFVNIAVSFAEPSLAVLTSVGPLALISSPIIPSLYAKSMWSIVTIIPLQFV
jgi:hypothetical protein